MMPPTANDHFHISQGAEGNMKISLTPIKIQSVNSEHVFNRTECKLDQSSVNAL